MGYSFRLAARVLLYAPSYRQDSTYHDLCYTSRGALAGTRNSSMGPSLRIDLTTHRILSERSYHRATSRSPIQPLTTNTITIMKHLVSPNKHRPFNLHSRVQYLRYATPFTSNPQQEGGILTWPTTRTNSIIFSLNTNDN